MIKEFLDKAHIKALDTLVSTTDDSKACECTITLSDVFGAGAEFKNIANKTNDSEAKLTSSFKKNLVLLIQKTWVEKTDEELKAQVLYQLDEFIEHLNNHSYLECYGEFFSIVDDVVYLMFGNQTKSDDFANYALRIDPEFGIFWWYITSLPRDAKWSEEKTRVSILLAMYFLANF